MTTPNTLRVPEPHRHGDVQGRKAGVVIASTRAAAGIYDDETGPVITGLDTTGPAAGGL